MGDGSARATSGRANVSKKRNAEQPRAHAHTHTHDGKSAADKSQIRSRAESGGDPQEGFGDHGPRVDDYLAITSGRGRVTGLHRANETWRMGRSGGGGGAQGWGGRDVWMRKSKIKSRHGR